MSDCYSTYRYITKCALDLGLGSLAAYGLGAASTGAKWGLSTAGDALKDLNPQTAPPDDTAAYNIVKGITRYLSPRVYDVEDEGPYKEFSDYLKDTEKGDLLLREAAHLRRKARILLKQKEEEEKRKRHAASSRYF